MWKAGRSGQACARAGTTRSSASASIPATWPILAAKRAKSSISTVSRNAQHRRQQRSGRASHRQPESAGRAHRYLGLGTRLVTGYDEPALGGVYKLAAIREADGAWQARLKLSEQAIKINTPGLLQVRRYHQGEEYAADMIFDEQFGIRQPAGIIDPLDSTRRKSIPPDLSGEDLLAPIFHHGDLVYAPPTLTEIQQRAHTLPQLYHFHAGVKRFINPHQFPVGLEQGVHERKTALILQARQRRDEVGDR